MARFKKSKQVSYDRVATEEFVKRFFAVEQEIKTLRLDKKELVEEFKSKTDLKLTMNVLRLVKAQLKMTASPETVEELSNIIKEKIGMILDS